MYRSASPPDTVEHLTSASNHRVRHPVGFLLKRRWIASGGPQQLLGRLWLSADSQQRSNLKARPQFFMEWKSSTKTRS